MNRFYSASLHKSMADVTRRKGRTLLVTLGIFISIFGLTVINSVEETLVSAFAFTRGYCERQDDPIYLAPQRLLAAQRRRVSRRNQHRQLSRPPAGEHIPID